MHTGNRAADFMNTGPSLSVMPAEERQYPPDQVQ